MTDSDRSRIILAIEHAQHLLLALPREPELTPSIHAQVEELEEARRLLLKGWPIGGKND